MSTFSVQSSIGLIEKCIASGGYQGAIHMGKHVLKTNPTDPKISGLINGLLAVSYFQLNRHSLAEEHIVSALKDCPKDLYCRIIQIEILKARGNLQKALEVLDETRDICPTSDPCYEKLQMLQVGLVELVYKENKVSPLSSGKVEIDLKMIAKLLKLKKIQEVDNRLGLSGLEIQKSYVSQKGKIPQLLARNEYERVLEICEQVYACIPLGETRIRGLLKNAQAVARHLAGDTLKKGWERDKELIEAALIFCPFEPAILSNFEKIHATSKFSPMSG